MSTPEKKTTQVFVSIFMSVDGDDESVLENVTHELLEGCDSVAGRVEANHSGVRVVAVQATK